MLCEGRGGRPHGLCGRTATFEEDLLSISDLGVIFLFFSEQFAISSHSATCSCQGDTKYIDPEIKASVNIELLFEISLSIELRM